MKGVGVTVREGEPFENAIRRFQRKIKQDGILAEARNGEAYEKPSDKRKRKRMAAKKRSSRVIE